MRAIRPIYDGKDDLEYRTEIDPVDMMVCMFSETAERIKAREDMTEEEKEILNELVDWEIVPDDVEELKPEVVKSPHQGAGFDEIIVMYEISRWMRECNYKYKANVPQEFKYTAQALGIIPVITGCGSIGKSEYIIYTGSRAMNELKLMLPLHWAVILLDWKLIEVDATEDKETIRFGNIEIHSDKGKKRIENGCIEICEF